MKHPNHISRTLITLLSSAAVFLLSGMSHAGSYPPQAKLSGSTAVFKDDTSIVGWATGYTGYESVGSNSGCDRGSNLTTEFETPERALGEAGNSDGEEIGTTFDIVSLGREGCITLTFDTAIADGDGFDFAVFENGFYVGTLDQAFLELAWVEVSSNGNDFFRFPAITEHDFPVSGFSHVMDATNFHGFAGKYIAGYGTPFDLDDLPNDPLLDKQAVTHVRIIDIIGDGNTFDNDTPSNPIYDPFATANSAGFDLDAVAVLNQAQAEPEEVINVPLPKWAALTLALFFIQSFQTRFGKSTY